MSLLTLLRGYFLRIAGNFPSGNRLGATLYTPHLSGTVTCTDLAGSLSTSAMRGALS